MKLTNLNEHIALECLISILVHRRETMSFLLMSKIYITLGCSIKPLILLTLYGMMRKSERISSMLSKYDFGGRN